MWPLHLHRHLACQPWRWRQPCFELCKRSTIVYYDVLVVLKMGQYGPLFSLFSIHLMINKMWQWLDSNCRSLVSEATALPTEPQPLPRCLNSLPKCASRIALFWEDVYIPYNGSCFVNNVSQQAFANPKQGNGSKEESKNSCCWFLTSNLDKQMHPNDKCWCLLI